MFRFFTIVILLLAGYSYYLYGGDTPRKDPNFKPPEKTVDLSKYNKAHQKK